MQINVCETGLGILAVAEGSTDLLKAYDGALSMDTGVFFDTFMEGGIEIGLSMLTENPILLAGGVQNILAGLISTWNTLVVHVDHVTFLGSAVTSALLGFAMGAACTRSSLATNTRAAIRSGVVGALFAVSPAFGFGALAGFVVHGIGGTLAVMHDANSQAVLKVDEAGYRMLIDELCRGNTHLHAFLDRARPRLSFTDDPPLLPSHGMVLFQGPRSLLDEQVLLSEVLPAALPTSFPPPMPETTTVFESSFLRKLDDSSNH